MPRTPRVVVVDDDATSAALLGKMLTKLGCTVTTCTDPHTAVRLALERDLDMVSLDLRMPGLTGGEVLALIRSHEHSMRLPSLPVITVTGKVTPDDRAHTLADGFAAHLGKPVLMDELRSALARALTLRNELGRTRYTEDKQSIESNMQRLRELSPQNFLQTVTGMALVLEQKGREVLHEALQMAYSGNGTLARRPVDEFDRLADALGASRMRQHLEDVRLRLTDEDHEMLEMAAVLGRAELDRVIFTLREQICTPDSYGRR